MRLIVKGTGPEVAEALAARGLMWSSISTNEAHPGEVVVSLFRGVEAWRTCAVWFGSEPRQPGPGGYPAGTLLWFGE